MMLLLFQGIQLMLVDIIKQLIMITFYHQQDKLN